MSAASPFPTYRGRYLPGMTRMQIGALPGKASAVVIVATGSVEQHGPHLPVGVDSILGQAWLSAALGLVPAHVAVYVGPPVTFGKSNEHTGFPGTVTVSARVLHRVLVAIARQVRDFGFRTLAILNTHGGNSPVIVPTLREIQTGLGLNAGMIAPWKPPVDEREQRFGIHAGRVETAWMLAVAPQLVHMERAVCEFPDQVDDPGRIKPATAAWISSDVSRTGVMGDATAASLAEGRAWFETGARSLAARIVELHASLSQA